MWRRTLAWVGMFSVSRGGAQACTESSKTVVIAGLASRPVLEEISRSWRLGYGIFEAMRGSVLGANLYKD